jgi:hypothetical protein
MHEDFSRREKVAAGSERSFGTMMATVIALLGLINYWHHGRVWPWLAGISCFFLAAVLLRPALLKWLNWLWFRFGLVLHAVINPVVMALLFYGAVWPTAVIMRAMGKHLLSLKPKGPGESYWIVRSPPGPRPETMKDQF